MPKKKTKLDRFADLTWNDIEKWAGGKIVSRGKTYQRQGRVSDLAVTDDGETAMEIADCMPVIVGALDRSSLDTPKKLIWALDAVLDDQFELCEAFAEYLYRRHSKSAWHTLADRLLARLKGLKSTKGADDFSRNYERDRLSDWTIHAMEAEGLASSGVRPGPA